MCGLPGDALDDGEGILGTYVVNGTDPTGVEYSGTVMITTADRRTSSARVVRTWETLCWVATCETARVSAFA